ncbi:2Fe-2S iron-sulfur cluster-binding protein [Hydrocarboniphaga effusa]|jgi:ferredoxin|uniref:2Fe-2S iron-sulfur cluster-binding protein n=1 Tax=Hydrocarboniphaga effusa TaxID=243629 RepID=UPI0031378C3C
MRFKVTMHDDGSTFACEREQPVLSAMLASGCRSVQVGCRSGGCGVCRVQIVEGQWEAGAMSRAQVDADARRAGYSLACRLYPRSDLRLRAVGRLVSAVVGGRSASAPDSRGAGR